MPLYGYECKDCGEPFEVSATIKEKEQGLDLTCPKCGGHAVRQLLTAGVILHGGTGSSQSCCGPNAGSGSCCG